MISPLSHRFVQAKWGGFHLKDLFEIKSSIKRFDANKVTVFERGHHPYIIRSGSNNGQRGYLKENEKFLNEGNTISFGQDTATLFYQKEPYFTGDKIKVLKSTLQQFEQKEALFFISSLNKAFSNFSWGSSRFNVKTIGNQIFNLPVREDNHIDFDFINSFMRQLEIEFLEVLKNYLAASGAPDFCFTKEETLAIESLKTKKFKNFSKYVKKARQNKYFNNLQNQKILLILQCIRKCFAGLLVIPVRFSSLTNSYCLVRS